MSFTHTHTHGISLGIILPLCSNFRELSGVSVDDVFLLGRERASEKGNEDYESIVNRASSFCASREILRERSSAGLLRSSFSFFSAPVVIPLFQNCYNPRAGCIIFRTFATENSRAFPAVYYSLANTVHDIHE